MHNLGDIASFLETPESLYIFKLCTRAYSQRAVRFFSDGFIPLNSRAVFAEQKGA